MNLALIDPMQLHEQLPETIEGRLLATGGGAVVLCSFNHRGNLLAGGCDDGKICVWDFDTRVVARTFEHHGKRITSLSWTRSSRWLCSSSLDGKLLLTNVLSPEVRHCVDFGAEVTHAALHPLKRRLCLACVQTGGATAAGVYLQHWQPEQRALLRATDEQQADDAAGAGASAAKRAPVVACFDASGDRVIVGTARGAVLLMSLDGQVAAQLQATGGAPIKSISLARNGASFVLNSTDRLIRAYPMKRLTGEGQGAGRELQDVVNKVQWSHAAFSSDSEHIIGASASTTQQNLCARAGLHAPRALRTQRALTCALPPRRYIWDLHGHLTKMLNDGPKDGALHFVCHPTRPILCCTTRAGVIYVWTKQYSENWCYAMP